MSGNVTSTGTAFYLDPTTWDLVVTPTGFKLATGNYATLQNVANAVRLFLGELWYNTPRGIPWFTILGKQPPTSFLKAMIETITLTVPNVSTAQCVFISFGNSRRLTGQIQVTFGDSTTQTVNFS